MERNGMERNDKIQIEIHHEFIFETIQNSFKNEFKIETNFEKY